MYHIGGLGLGLTVITRSIDTSDKQEDLRSTAPNTAVFSARVEEMETTEDDLETINEEHSDVELGEEDVVVFRDHVAHDEVPQVGMRRPLAFTEDALNKFAEDYQRGRTFNMHHETRRSLGSTFDAEVSRQEIDGVDAHWLSVRWYAVTKNASEQRMQDIMDATTGVLRYTSMEVRGGDWKRKQMDEDDEDDERTYYQISDNPDAGTDRLEAEGIARVHLGAVRGAGSA